MKRLSLIIFCFALIASAHAERPLEQGLGAQMAAVRADENAAVQQVIKIVNQPVTHLPRDMTPGKVGMFAPGWFKPGADVPRFETVDVTKSQLNPYVGHEYVSSDLNPTEMFIAAELEFNPMTKYFYTDRTVPKKRLTEAEMMEINRLYRVIAADDKKLEDLKTQAIDKAPGGPWTLFWLMWAAVVGGAIGLKRYWKKKA
jgi:hypothetical protein